MLSTQQIRELSNDELLLRIAEESSEVIKAAMKFMLYGHRPRVGDTQYDNFSDVWDEFHQLGRLVSELELRRMGGREIIVSTSRLCPVVPENPQAPRCSVCNEAQFSTPHGLVCKNGHGGA